MPIGFPLNITLPTSGQVQWDSPLNEALQTIIDAVEAAVTADGIDLQSSLDLQGNYLINVKGLKFTANTDDGSARQLFFKSDGELYARDGAGRSLQITSSGSLNISLNGGFGGDYASSSAQAIYSSSGTKFTFTSSPGIYATMEAGDLQVHNGGSSTYVDVKASPIQGSTYNMTLPSGVPSAVSVVTMDTTGTLAASRDVGLTSLTASNSLFTNARLTGPQPSSGYALVIADSTGTLSTLQTGSAFTEYWDGSQGKGIGVSATYDGTGWTLPASNGLIIPIPYQIGDQIVGVGFAGVGSGELTASIIHRGSGKAAFITRLSVQVPGDSLYHVYTMSGSVYTMTGTLPYTPPGTGSLHMFIQNGASSSTVTLDTFKIIRNRKLV